MRLNERGGHGPLVNSGRAAVAARSTIRVRETIELAAIFEPHLNVVVLEREAPEVVARYASRLARGPAMTVSASVTFDPDDGTGGMDEVGRMLPADDARDCLLTDLAYWVEVMAELTGAANIGVRLAQLTAPMCPTFHVDAVPLRLVCTYSGPCSEWLDSSAIAASGLIGPRVSSRTIRRDAHVETCSPFDVLLLKGSAWPGNALHGAIHRSPSAHGSRLLVTLDPLG